jgi:hypothetical protein
MLVFHSSSLCLQLTFADKNCPYYQNLFLYYFTLFDQLCTYTQCCGSGLFLTGSGSDLRKRPDPDPNKQKQKHQKSHL